MKVVTLTSKLLAPRVAQCLGVELVRPSKYDMFRDKESWIVFDSYLEEKIRDEQIILIQSTYPDQARIYNDLYSTIPFLKKHGATSVTLVLPYAGFMRQHKDFAYEKGEGYQVVMGERVPHNLMNCGVDFVYTINSHSTDVFVPEDVKTIYGGDLNATPYFVKEFRKMELSEFVVVSPDKGSKEKGKSLAGALKVDHIYMDKNREFHHGDVSITGISAKPKKDIAVIFDDQISAGGTIIAAVKDLKTYGVKKIIVACVHALMVDDAEEKIMNEGVSEIISTDSIENRFSRISLSPLIASLFKS